MKANHVIDKKNHMSTISVRLALVAALCAMIGSPLPVSAGKQKAKRFSGVWAGQTVSAAPTEDPAVIAVVTAGEGVAQHLGHYSMVSPHNSHLDTLAADGLQIFTAANGDEITAEFTGQFAPTPDGFLQGVLDATISGGTGRFAGATGSYTFFILFDPATFQSVAVFDGTITIPGK